MSESSKPSQSEEADKDRELTRAELIEALGMHGTRKKGRRCNNEERREGGDLVRRDERSETSSLLAAER